MSTYIGLHNEPDQPIIMEGYKLDAVDSYCLGMDVGEGDLTVFTRDPEALIKQLHKAARELTAILQAEQAS